MVKLNFNCLKIKVFFKYYILFWVSVAAILPACAPQKNGPVASVYHNTTARYNAYFYARQRIEEIEAAIDASNENNFNTILNIYPKIDTAVVAGLQEQIEDCIKKSSIAIERHPKSKWVDDSYILVGLCRFYNGDYGNAIQTFKYVNVNSKDKDARHRALIDLMRTFIDASEQNNAIAVSDYLKKEKLNRSNKIQLHLTRAYLSKQQEDFSNVVSNLLVAAPLMRNDEGKAKIYYIIGQIYQQLGFDAEAYSNYQKVLRSNPEYELFFYARLNMAQVYDLSRNSDIRKIRKYFRKLLKDQKNKEYKDKIYYEMAAFEQKQGNLEDAIELYNNSIVSSISNNRQKAYSYLALGKIYYEELKEYKKAKAYYDSTLTVLPADEPDFEQIANRQEVLAAFVEQLNIIETQDSLLALAEMDTASLSAYLEEVAASQQAQREATAKVAAQQQRRTQRSSNSLQQIDNPFAQNAEQAQDEVQGDKWYFYNAAALSSGRTAFTRKWGNRSLEDNWRRSEKSVAANLNQTPVAVADTTTADAGNKQSAEEIISSEKAMMMSEIPFSDSAKVTAYKKIEDAYFSLGNIYNFQLEEPTNAAQTFDTLLIRFPETPYKPEVLYQLYLITKGLEDSISEKYKNQLLNEFPNSTFAKILLNPNYREENNVDGERLKKTYKLAYNLYNRKHYPEAMQLLQDSLQAYPDNPFSDNVVFLEAMITGKMDGDLRYQLALQNFIKEYPDSELITYAEKLQETAKEFKEKRARERRAEFISEFEEQHTFVLVYDRTSDLSNELLYEIEVFNKNYFTESNLKTANLALDNNKLMIIVQQFPGKDSSYEYYKAFNGENSPLKRLAKSVTINVEFNNFVITEDNFDILYQTKDMESYLRFFSNNYGIFSIN